MKPTLDLSLYLVLDPELCGGLEGMVATARAAAENGASVVQLRAPHWKKRQWVAAATRLKATLDPLQVPLIINDHIDVALLVDAAGVHVGQQDIHPQHARTLIGPHKWLGLSVSNAAQMDAVVPAGLDYLGVGPVFVTGTKLDAAPVIGIETFAALMRAKPLPVVAIGGIGLGRVAPLLAAGADGVAVISAICGQSDPAAATRQLRREGWPG
ncbi:MAG: thiamine phosphate synthase [Burkholderiaceae bacterium]